METTLKITNVLSDPTRYKIYHYITTKHREVTVQEIADEFDIHPNVARLHLTKLEDVNMLVSETKKTGKGGRPSRLYRLSDEVIQLNFPYRDYQLLSKIAIETFISLGEVGRQALYETGKKYGTAIIEQVMAKNQLNEDASFEQKIKILESAATMAGLYPSIEVSDDKKKVFFQIYNCPFKEVATDHVDTICSTHAQFIRGMFEALFDNIELVEKSNLLEGCDSCTYHANVAN